MRAVVTKSFHDPLTNELLERGRELTNDADILRYESDSEHGARISISDRNPGSAQAPTLPQAFKE